jgi:hypothetical protein
MSRTRLAGRLWMWRPVVDNTTNLPRSNTAKRNRAYGFNAEAELLQFLRERGIEAERLYLTGKEDEGDILAEWIPGARRDGAVVIQLKTWAQKSAKGEDRSLSPTGLRRWLQDLEDQRRHYAAHRGLSELPGGMLVVRFKGRSWDEALVISQLKEWL